MKNKERRKRPSFALAVPLHQATLLPSGESGSGAGRLEAAHLLPALQVT